jgi:hypothetical protein
MAFRYSYHLVGPAEYVVRKFKVAANQDIKYGNLVKLNASGKVVEAAAAATNILGVALEDKATGASPTDADTLNVLVPVSFTVFEADYAGSTKTSLTDADIGVVFDIVVGSDGDHKVNLDDTTGGMCKVVAFDNARKVAYVIITSRLLA